MGASQPHHVSVIRPDGKEWNDCIVLYTYILNMYNERNATKVTHNLVG